MKKLLTFILVLISSAYTTKPLFGYREIFLLPRQIGAAMSTTSTILVGSQLALQGLDKKFLKSIPYESMIISKAMYDTCAAVIEDEECYMQLTAIVQAAITNMLNNNKHPFTAACYGTLEQGLKELGHTVIDRFNKVNNPLPKRIVRVASRALVDALARNMVEHLEHNKEFSLKNFRQAYTDAALMEVVYNIAGEFLVFLLYSCLHQPEKEPAS